MNEIREEPDEELIRRAREGDHQAFHALSDRYAGKLDVYVKRRLLAGVQRKVGVSDILQEAHLVALERLGDFEDRGQGSFGRWFRRIVDLKIRQTLRHHLGADKRSVGLEVTRTRRAATGEFRGRGPSPSQVAAGNELRDAAEAALARLPEHFRETLRLLQDEQLTLVEAADRMGRSPDAVKKLYGRALARLEELMGLRPEEGHGRRRPTR